VRPHSGAKHQNDARPNEGKVSPRPVDPSDSLLDTNAAALLLGVSPTTLYTWRSYDWGPPYIKMTARSATASGATGKKLKGTVRYRLSDLHAWLADRLVQPGRRLPSWCFVANRPDRPPRAATTPLGLDRTEGAAVALRVLWDAIRAAGSPWRWAAENGVDYLAVHAVLEGTKVMPPRVAEAIGFRCVRVVRYERIKSKKDERSEPLP